MRLVFDIEGNGLLRDVTKIWCIVAEDVDTGAVHFFRPHHIEAGCQFLAQADCLIGHNIIGYDLPVLQKLHDFRPKGQVVDTAVLAKLVDSDREKTDYAQGLAHLAGSNTLKAWGHRLGELKGTFGEEEGETAWDAFSLEMLEYCRQDVKVNTKLWKWLKAQTYTPEAYSLEAEFSVIARDLELHGFRFDVESAKALVEKLENDKAAIQLEVDAIIPPTVHTMKTPQFWTLTTCHGVEEWPTKSKADARRKELGVSKKTDYTITPGPLKTNEVPFNIGSRKQVREYLHQVHDWVSPELTDKGLEREKEGESRQVLAVEYGKISEDVLQAVDFPVAKLAARCLMINKLLGTLQNGQNSWLKLQQDGRIHHRLQHIGAATHRTAHSNPNLGQVPSVITNDDGIVWGESGKYGAECRSLFLPDEGDVLVGCDLAGIEGRMLAHFLAPFDDGVYADVILNGDVHTLNADSISKQFKGYASVSRKNGKPLYYGFLYGAGDYKLGLSSSVEESIRELHGDFTRQYRVKRRLDFSSASREAYKHIGRFIRKGLVSSVDGLEDFVNQVQAQAERGFLSPLDGRRIPVRSSHAALNTLLQGSAAIVFKRWCVILKERIRQEGLRAKILALVHDEVQASVHPEDADNYMSLSVECIKQAGEFYQLRLPLDGEAKKGLNWCQTH